MCVQSMHELNCYDINMVNSSMLNPCAGNLIRKCYYFQDVNADDVCEEEEKEESGGGKLVNGFGSLSVGSPDCRQLLSSSLEAEQR